MDSKSSIVSEFSGSGFYIAQFKTNELAIFSYYVESEGLVTLIDPTFDTNIYHEILCKRNATLTHVFLTHYHADFLSGHTQLKATVVMGKNSKRAVNQFELHEAEDGEFVHIGSIKFQVIHTPGHTLESSCFLLYNKDAVATAMFTGDTVFLGDVGRPDLAIASTITKYDLAGYLYDSIQKLKPYHDDIRVYPAHGAGSACGKAIGTGNFCTLGEQKKNNSGFTQSEK
jgi:glyoxylase-like metal-dependent hydrolase (beta-lactamase superfamily II)